MRYFATLETVDFGFLDFQEIVCFSKKFSLDIDLITSLDGFQEQRTSVRRVLFSINEMLVG